METPPGTALSSHSHNSGHLFQVTALGSGNLLSSGYFPLQVQTFLSFSVGILGRTNLAKLVSLGPIQAITWRLCTPSNALGPLCLLFTYAIVGPSSVEP